MIYIFGGAFDPPHVGHAAIIKSLLAKKHPEKIVIVPSSERDDKKYHVTDEHRLAMLEIFARELNGAGKGETQESRVIIDDYFMKHWKGEMITKDVDVYCREQYGEDIVHIFGSDTIESMPSWDSEGYAAKVVKKLFVPRMTTSESSPQGGELEGCVVSESPPEGGELEGCVTFISPKSHIYLKEYASELRKNQTYPEYIAWNNIFSKKQLSQVKFLRQHTLGPYIVDFYAHALKLVIEIDGDIHSSQRSKDNLRDIFFQSHGFTVLRIPAYEILGNCSGVFEFLTEFINKKTAHPPNLPILGRDGTTGTVHSVNPTQPPLFRGGEGTTGTAHSVNPSQPPLFRGGEGTADAQNHLNLVDIENYEILASAHIPDISSTELRNVIPEYTDLKAYYEEEPKFIIPGLSKKISQYILENRLYRPKIENKPKVLVHVCCGPDVTMPILALRDEYDVVCFWYDPNIQPKAEHDKRYEAFVKVCEIENIPYIKGAYDVKHFFTRIKGLEFTPEKGEKCTNCYDMRMYVAAKLAKTLKIPFYTSSLNTSPKKDLEKLFVMGHKYAEKYGITFLDIPFRKKGGFEKSVEYTREHDIFRQNYCGCIYSIREGGESEMKGRMVG